MTERKSKKRANLRDVAKAAQVSVATVSRVLNSPEVVSDSTRVRVHKAIEELHFVPSAAARAINSGRTRVVGALVPTLDNAIFAMFLASMERELDKFGLSLVVATTEESSEIEAEKAKRLIDIGAEALIVSGVTHSTEFDELIARTRLPTIATSYFDNSYHLPTIGYDNRHAAQIALEHLNKAGHRKIVVIHGPQENNDRTQARLSGLKTLDRDKTLSFYPAGLSFEGAALAVQNALQSETHFTAVLCTSDVLAVGALFELQRHGWKVPNQVSLISIDDLAISSKSVPGITTVRLPVDEMGQKTAKAAVNWIETGIEPQAQLIEVELIVRESVTAVP